MKSFKNSVRVYTRDQMLEWCNANIIGFNIDDYEADGFYIYEKTQTVFCNQTIFIRTRDEELPFLFKCSDGYYVAGEKLTDINLLHFDMNITNKFVFDGCNDINFNRFAWVNNRNFEFHYSDINPKNIHDVAFNSLVIKCAANADVCDFANYNTSVKIEEFSIAPGFRFKNLIRILDLEILYVYILNTMTTTYNGHQCKTLDNIIDRYNTNTNRKDFVMDMTVDLIDAGFEDEV